MLDKLTVDHFAPARGQAFKLDAGDGTQHDLELTDASTWDAGAPPTDESGARSAFRLQFRGPIEPILEQRIYHLEHDTVGPIDIFLVPIGQDAAGTSYEAIFA